MEERNMIEYEPQPVPKDTWERDVEQVIACGRTAAYIFFHLLLMSCALSCLTVIFVAVPNVPWVLAGTTLLLLWVRSRVFDRVEF